MVFDNEFFEFKPVGVFVCMHISIVVGPGGCDKATVPGLGRFGGGVGGVESVDGGFIHAAAACGSNRNIRVYV